MMRAALVVLLAYLLGSIPFGYLIVRLQVGADIRESGSGGTGATNVSRRAGKRAGLVTLLLDALKGVLAIFVARLIIGEATHNSEWWVAAAGIAVLLGHIFPVWLGFRGGKGVATGVGVFVVLTPIAMAFAGLLFILIVWSTRYVSLGSIAAAAALPFLILLQNLFAPVAELGPLLLVAVVGALLIIFAHRENIRRLVAGTESKFR
ncbi:MAG: glycerol-3-phosphate 1-O-acyltransferase PlsY [Pyrinomonadaceae bacterium]